MRFQKTYRTLSIFIIALLLFTAFPLVPVAQAKEFQFEENRFDIRKIHPSLIQAVFQGEEIEDIGVFGDYIRGFVSAEPESLVEITRYVQVIYVAPQVGDRLLIFGTFRSQDLVSLASISGVSRILPDWKLDFSEPDFEETEASGRGISTNMFEVRRILGADVVNEELGYTGDGVRVAVVDTGVDYGNPNLAGTLGFDSLGNPMAFDADTLGLVYPFFSFEAVDGFLPTAGESFFVYDGFVFWVDEFPWITGDISFAGIPVNVPVDIDVTGIPSASGVYKLGFLVEYDLITGVVFYPIPVLYTDPTTPGVYDTVYFDLTSYYFPVYVGTPRDWSFADETAYGKGGIVAEDYTGDGIPDVSLGVAGTYFLDSPGFFGTGFMEGWSLDGEYLDVFYDFAGHGTQVAASVASTGAQDYDIYFNGSEVELLGIAPDAQIVGVQGLWMGFVEAGFFWAAGFDTVFTEVSSAATQTSVEVPFMVFSGETRAEIVSNSFGISGQLYDTYGFGYDIESIFESAFMVPGYLDPDFPGVLMVHAAGNGGSGYGTMTTMGSSMALTVGASTSQHWSWINSFAPYWYEDPESAQAGVCPAPVAHCDDVVSWSARGPGPLGDVKPDVMNLGQTGFTAAKVSAGFGSGFWAWDLFGGTSWATPLTSGSAALAYHAWREKHGTWPTPFEAKQYIQNTADSLNNEAQVQGSGRVNALKLVQAVEADPKFLAKSTFTFENLASQLFYAWDRLWGTPFPFSDDLAIGSVYAGRVDPGTSTEFTITLENPTTTEMTVTPDAYIYGIVDSPIIIEGEIVTDAFYLFDPAEFMDADFLRIDTYIPFEVFDADGNYGIDSRIDLVVGEWFDLNSDGELQLGEFARMTYSFRRSNQLEVTVNNPYDRMADPVNNKLVVFIFRVDQTLNVPESYPYTIEITKYAKTPWTWISFDADSVPLSAGETADLGVTLSVPADSGPSYMAGHIRLVSDDPEQVLIPLSVVVPLVLDGSSGSIGTGMVDESQPYDQYSVRGHFDWNWRYESGDWRFFVVRIDDFFIRKIDVTVNWQHPDSNIDIFVLGPGGGFIGWTDTGFDAGSGIFIWHSTLSETSSMAESYPFYSGDDTGITTDGYYTVYIHNVLYGGTAPAEPFTIDIEVESGTVATAEGRILFTSTTVPASVGDPLFTVESILGEELAASLELSTSVTSVTGDAAVIGGPGALVPVNTNDVAMYTLTVGLTGTGWTGFHHLLGYRQKTGFFKFFGFPFGYSYLQLDVWPHMQILLG